MEELIRLRGRTKAKLTRICAFGELCDAGRTSAVEIQIKLDMLTDVWAEFDKTQSRIECECKEDDLASQQEEQETFESKFFMIKTKLLSSIAHLNKLSTGNDKQSEHPRIKLPAIELQSFHGDYKTWAAFSDLFQSVVHQNNTLSPVQKLHYLKSSVKGEAAGLLNSIAITDANYQEAWKILSDRYSNRRQVIQSHLKAMYSQPKLTSESAGDLRKLLDVTVENVRALHALDLPTDEWDCLLIYLITERLDSDTRRQWELAVGDAENPAFDNLKDFIERRCRAIEASGEDQTNETSNSRPLSLKSHKRPMATSHHVAIEDCANCKEKHMLYQCESFKQLSVDQRIEIVRDANLCFNCMRSKHLARECKAQHCRKCQQRHHTLIHREREPVKNDANTDVTTLACHRTKEKTSHTQILLATAVVDVIDSSGSWQPVRVLLDSGSQATFITEACVKKLNLKRQRTDVTIGGLGASEVGVCKGVVHLQMRSKYNSCTYQMQALILRHVTGIMPPHPIDPTQLKATILSHQLELADPGYHCPSHIDILVGADVYFDLMQSGRIKDSTNNTIIQNTSLGWIVSGPILATSTHLVVVSHLGLQDLNQQLKAFWELEENAPTSQWSPEEVACEEHFKKTFSRNDNGRFVVMLPFKDNCLPQLGDSSDIAKICLLQMEKRLKQKPDCRKKYNEFIAEYEQLGHMEIVNCKDRFKGYYLPHHYVIRESSLTTKLRIVFDGTALPTSGVSLNSILMVGPTIQPELLDIVLRFRMHNFVMIADITKMYRQILVHPNHQNYQKIKWRSSHMEPIQDYRLKTVTYGTASAPFLAVRCLNQLAIDGETSHRLASAVIKRDFYVDDLLTGANTILEAQKIQEQLIDLLSSAGLELRKWSSNSNCLIEHLPKELQNKEPITKLTSDSIKTLGIQWHPGKDHFSFSVTRDELLKLTKRTVVSQIAKLFDPLGWLSPVIVCAKIMIQRLWLSGIGWDDNLPPDIASTWRHYYEELNHLEQILIPRQLVSDSVTDDCQLHGFCDASETAYGAMILIRSGSNHNIVVRLVCSKTKVAPLKKVSLPRLELCGALVLARLLKRVMLTLAIPYERTYAWSDSSIVLSWLKKPSYYWKTFVANRVAEVQESVPPERWGHVNSLDNPADCLSRGLSPKQLLSHKLWWSGPSWLSQDISSWPQHSELVDETGDMMVEAKKPRVEVHIATANTFMAVEDYSSLSRLMHVTSYCRRFIKNCRESPNKRTKGHLTVKELQDSLTFWISRAQIDAFNQEIQCCINKSLPTKSKLISLSPFVDKVGLLRVGGRLQHSVMTFNQKHPLILPHHHALTLLLIRHEHLKNLHAGSQLLQTVLRRKYWIIKSKQIIKHMIHKCIQCFRNKAATSQQLMGSLPQSRVEPMRAFMRCGVDYAGPILLKLAKGRGQGRTHKAYISIFICFTTKAIHIELVNDLTTSSFIAALHRFTSRRGRPSDIYSDCGTNFIGADRVLRELGQLLTSSSHNTQIAQALSDNGINWHFSPPSSPHFGGLWEAGVKSIKFHLRRIIGDVVLTYEELYTVLTQIEACLNSRPLCPISSEPNELAALTPGHFLIGDALLAVPDQDVTELKINRLCRWQLVQRLFQHFWKRWSSEYLSRLQQRPKWALPKNNIKVGDLVLLKEESSPLKWPMGRVITVHPGEDGLVRVVTVRTTMGEVKRPIVKCCVMPTDTVQRTNHQLDYD